MPSTFNDFYGGDLPLWVSSATVQQYASVRSPGDGQAYVRMTATGSGVTDPKDDSANYRPAGGRAIKSVQRGTISLGSGVTSNTATISAVVTGKCELRMLGQTTTASDLNSNETRIALTNTTTITASRANGAGGDVVVGWELTEYY